MNPSNPTLGRGLLLFAALIGGLSAVLAVQGSWRDAALWFAVSIVAACYGLITLNWLQGQQRWLLVLGLAAGVTAFGLALQASFAGR